MSPESIELVEPVEPIKGLKNMKQSKKELQDAYMVMQKASGIEIGDKVRVLRKASDYEMGWGNVWPYINVGQIGTVGGMSRAGVHLKFDDARGGLGLPFFILEVVEKAPKQKFPLTFDDIPRDVLIAIRDKYQRIFDKGYRKYNSLIDWRSKTCPMCQYIKEKFYDIVKPTDEYEELNINECVDICPLTKDGWCKGRGGRLYLDDLTNPDTWTNDVAEFICMLNKHLANRKE